jgi:hypothetical protein
VGYARTNLICSRTSFFVESVRSSIHGYIYTYLGVIRSRPTAYCTVTIQHNHLNRKNIIQNQKYKCKNNIKLIYLTFIYCTCKFESINSLSLVKTMNKLSLIKSINNLTHMKSVNSLSLVKTIIELSIIKAYKILRCSIRSLYKRSF